MTIQENNLLKYNSIEELLDDMTTEKSTGKKLIFSDIGSDEEGYRDFKSRFESFKEVIERDLPELTKDEIIKFNRHYHSFREIYKWSGFDILLRVLEWEQLKNKKQ